MVCGPQRYCDVSTSGFTSSRNATLRGSIVDGPEALEKGEECEIHWNYTKFHTPVPSPVPSDDEEGEEDEDDHWDEDDIDEDAEDGFIISTDGPVMIEGEDLDFEDGHFDGDDASSDL